MGLTSEKKTSANLKTDIQEENNWRCKNNRQCCSSQVAPLRGCMQIRFLQVSVFSTSRKNENILNHIYIYKSRSKYMHYSSCSTRKINMLYDHTFPSWVSHFNPKSFFFFFFISSLHLSSQHFQAMKTRSSYDFFRYALSLLLHRGTISS